MKTLRIILKCNGPKWRFILLIAFSLFIKWGTAQSFLSHSNQKYQTTQIVFNNIVSAFSDPTLAAPKLEINNKTSSQKYIAAYIPGNEDLIIIDEDLYDLAVTFESDSLDALASIISHELAHYYKEHNFCSDFAFVLGKKHPLAIRIRKEEQSEKESVEAQADYYGMFYGFLAGYNTLNTFPQLLDQIYIKYELPEKIRGYPSKKERKDIAIKRAKEVERWITIFDAGELLFSLRKYDDAYLCFDYLSKKFPSREIFNNMAVIRLYQAIGLVKTEDQPFLLPIEFDAETRLKKGALRDLESHDSKIQKYIEEAIEILEKSNRLDPKYLNSQINLGCAYMILNKVDQYKYKAIDIANSLLTNTSIKHDAETLSRLYTLRGLWHFYNGDMKNARKDLQKAKQTNSTNLTTYNIIVFDKLEQGPIEEFVDKFFGFFNMNKTKRKPRTSPDPINPLDEKVGNKNTNQISFSEPREPIDIENDFNKVKITDHNAPTYSEMNIASKRVHLKALCTKYGYTGKTFRGLGLNDPITDIYKTYGRPTYIIEALNGKYLKYEKGKIIFYVNSSGKITKWWIYQFN